MHILLLCLLAQSKTIVKRSFQKRNKIFTEAEKSEFSWRIKKYLIINRKQFAGQFKKSGNKGLFNSGAFRRTFIYIMKLAIIAIVVLALPLRRWQWSDGLLKKYCQRCGSWTENQYELQWNLCRQQKIRACKNADKIAFIQEGERIEFGTHEELMQIPNGFYKNLYQLQFKVQEEQQKEQKEEEKAADLA